ncbi:serine dehydratase-like isoform X2 [Heterocephalus glaber]|uniref:L-serine deaminase n=1 Tax=Heterocephalus glaber TaxID=10181 RepID=A0AAX6SXM7_HETGA|nr:serine dehydratase-like isoform X2 [Heterocephalus glaber]
MKPPSALCSLNHAERGRLRGVDGRSRFGAPTSTLLHVIFTCPHGPGSQSPAAPLKGGGAGTGPPGSLRAGTAVAPASCSCAVVAMEDSWSERFHTVSPLLRSWALSQMVGTDVFLKCENMQPMGSFKIRGIGHFCQEVARKGCRHLVCSSGGNAGLAAAYSARKLGLPATIVLPEATAPQVVRRLQGEGAEVLLAGKVWDDANLQAQTLAQRDGWVYVSPFDHPLICVATSLGAKTATAQALVCAQQSTILSRVVQDAEAVSAVQRFLDDERMLVEPACGAALAAIYSGLLGQLQAEGRLSPSLASVVVIVCGGNNIDSRQLQSLQTQLGQT